jgi:dihydroorotate dehydrogenase
MSLYSLIRPLLFRLDAETIHHLTIGALTAWRPGRTPRGAFDEVLAMELAGLRFPTPIGLAAGFDKDAVVARQFLSLGFGFAEVGTLTPLPQAGNPRPRLFRLTEDAGVINRMGFNNQGQQAALLRLKRLRAFAPHALVGVNIGANKDATDRIADYVTGVRQLASVASYLTINISSPNTPGLRALQDKGALADLLDAVNAARGPETPPIFLKVAPDLQPADLDDIAALAIDKRMDALIVANTTISRPSLRSRHAGEAGGLSGAPLKTLAAQRLRDFRTATGGGMPLIAVGGIDSADEAYSRIRAGASLVQLYSALVYHGPGVVRQINAGLARRLRADGFDHIMQAIGVDA